MSAWKADFEALDRRAIQAVVASRKRMPFEEVVVGRIRRSPLGEAVKIAAWCRHSSGGRTKRTSCTLVRTNGHKGLVRYQMQHPGARGVVGLTYDRYGTS